MLGEGRVVKSDSPSALMVMPDGIFHSVVK